MAKDLFSNFFDDLESIFFEARTTLRQAEQAASRQTAHTGVPSVALDLPGRAREDLKVYTKGGMLHIEAKAVKGRPQVHEVYLLTPLHDPTKVKARLKDGVLTVTVGLRSDSGVSVPID